MTQVKISLFAQVLQLIHRNSFDRLVSKHQTDKHCKGFNSWSHCVSMIFMQLSGVNSLRDIATGLRSITGDLNHLGHVTAPSKSNLSYQNKRRNFELFRDVYFKLLDKYEPCLKRRRRYANRLKRKVYLLDSSIIPLCLSLFDWAKFRTTKGALKLHAVLDYDTGLPAYACITEGNKADIKAAKEMVFPESSVVVVDRAYVDYAWLNNLDSSKVIFVTRLKSNADIEVIQSYLTDEKKDHIISDQDIKLKGYYSSKSYSGKLRIVKVYDSINDQQLILLTNQLSWTADHISQLYKARWDVEVFFKHVKQQFRIKSFVGTSPNAVRIQIWCSLISMLLLKYLQNKATYKWNLSNLITFARITLFVKIDLWKWLNNPFFPPSKGPPNKDLFNYQ